MHNVVAIGKQHGESGYFLSIHFPKNPHRASRGYFHHAKDVVPYTFKTIVTTYLSIPELTASVYV